MSIQFTVPEGFQYVGASLLSTVLVLIGQNITVGRWRKRSGIQYPQLYAEKKEAEASREALIFNCAQRAHHNTLENHPIIVIATLLSGLKYPILAASACAIWSLSRISYTRGYLTGDPAKRAGIIYFIGSAGMTITLLVAAAYAVGQAIYIGH